MPHTKSKKRFSFLIIVPVIVLMFFSVLEVRAQSYPYNSGENPTPSQGSYPYGGGNSGSVPNLGGNNSGSVPRLGGNNTGATSLQNPLKSDSLTGFLLDLIDVIILFAIPIIILFIIYAGFLYVMARGNEEKVTTATRALTYAVIGGLLIVGAKLLLEIIQGTVDQLVI